MGMTDNDLIVHLVNTPNFWKGRVDPKVSTGGVVGGLILAVAAAAREAVTGGDQLLMGLLIAAAIVGSLFVYGCMRLWNATVFVRDDRVGITNWLGFGQTVPVKSVDHFHRTAEVWTGEQLP